MKIKKSLGKIIPFLDSDLRKKRIVNTILNTPQKNIDVINIHRHDFHNVGDYYCAPHLYFDVLKDKVVDISDFRRKNPKVVKNWMSSVSNNSLIIGGGGLLNLRHFEIQMKLFESLSEMGKKIVLWGPGHNAIDYDQFNKNKLYNIDVDKFGLSGTRDFGMTDNWVPCVSCLHPIFDNQYETDQEVGLLFGKKTIKDKALLKRLESYPSTSNTTSLEEMISFIGRSNIIVTDSYHAMYWSFLLGKKVIAIPTTSKFFDFKYPPIISTFETFEQDIKKAPSYSGILEECREVNLKFADKVFDYLNI
jgi:hypothetical protein